MTESVADPAQQAASTNTQTSERRPVWRQPEIEVLGLALVMAHRLAGGDARRARPRRCRAPRRMVGVHHRRRCCSGCSSTSSSTSSSARRRSRSRCRRSRPHLALVFLSPPGALLARLPISLVVLLVDPPQPALQAGVQHQPVRRRTAARDRAVPGARRLVGRLRRRGDRRRHAVAAGHRAACRR